MHRSPEQLRADAIAIWRAAVDAVDSERLVKNNLEVQGHELRLGDEILSLDDIDRIVVVGGGKAGAGMAAGVCSALGSTILDEKRVSGWINVPADCVPASNSGTIHLHSARPAGVNEPTEAGVAGAQQILSMVAALGPRDLCLCLLSGGGSALLPAPIPGVSLADKQAITRFLSGAGSNIRQLNTVRKQLSLIKGGGLARACRAGRLVTFIISDVLGDPLDIIASGPTVFDRSSPEEALAMLDQFGARAANVAPGVIETLERKQASWRPESSKADLNSPNPINLVIGNNAVAVDAAGVEAEKRGYSHAMLAATNLEGLAEDVGRQHAEQALLMRTNDGPDCLITGGEPTVRLAPAEKRGKGGRNQQLVLAAYEQLTTTGNCEGIVLLSGGTDGEDGPTDAAGAWIDASVARDAEKRGLNAHEILKRNDAYHFFEPLGALLKTGPTHTNVCDVRVVLVARQG